MSRASSEPGSDRDGDKGWASLTPYECVEIGDNGAILNAILDNPEADRFISETAIARAMQRGMSEERAFHLYGLPDAPPR